LRQCGHFSYIPLNKENKEEGEKEKLEKEEKKRSVNRKIERKIFNEMN